jgi:hypothetical protein
MYRVPEQDKGYQYIVADTCGSVYFVETNAWAAEAKVMHKVLVLPCR